MEITSNDILSLANAYVAIRQNNHLGNDYDILNERCQNKILATLESATNLYRKQLEKSLKEE